MGLLNAVKSRGCLIGCGTLLLVGTVVVVGMWLEWGWVVTLLVLAVALLFLGMVGVLMQIHARSASNAIEQQIAAQAQQQLMSVRPDQRPEIQQLQEQLERAIETLKQSKLGKGRWRPGGGKAALYALPWYLFIGPPGAGKTTAIAHSGLNFPVGSDRIQGVGGTRNCDWFFTDKAILLDTAGRYVTEPEDSDEWYAFLDTLKKHRRERPINGVLVGIALDELAGASPAEVDDHADTIRRRLDELIRRLGVRFPVYLLFTKADLLHGFVEFFGERGRREREAIWGATLTAEQQRAPDLRAVFEREFDLLEDELVNTRTAALGRALKREERSAIYHFPLQFAALKPNLSRFVERLYQPNPYQETPLVRGFYFTSGTQEGVPIDRVIQNLAARFDLPPELAGGFQAEPEPKSYFIKDLFNEVVVPDQYLVRNTSKAASRLRLAKAGGLVAALLGLVLFALLVSQATVRSRANLGHVRNAAELAASVHWDAARPSSDDLRRLDSLRIVIDRYDGGLPPLQIGLNRRGTVLVPARGLYLRKARSFVETYAMGRIRRRLSFASSTDIYEDLKAFLLLTEESERVRAQDTTDAVFLRRHLANAARASIYGSDSIGVGVEMQERIDATMAAFVDGIRAGRVDMFEPQTGLVERVREFVYQRPSVEGLYERIKSDGNARVEPFRFPDAVSPSALGLFASSPEVSGFFTRDGWETFAAERLPNEAANPSRDDWVWGRTAVELPAIFQDSEQLLARLLEIYFADYAQAWQRFMQEVRYQQPTSARHAAGILEALASTADSPLLSLLSNVTRQTTLDAGEGMGLMESISEALGQQVGRIMGREGEEGASNPVARNFAALHALGADQAAGGGASAELYQAFSALGLVGAALDEMADDPSGGTESDNHTDDVQNDALDEIRDALSRLNPETRRALFEEPVRGAWEVARGIAEQRQDQTLREELQDLNEAWREDVYDPFRSTLAGRYPFNPNSNEDAPLGDFEDFFRPGSGKLDQFYASIEPRLDDSENPLRISAAARSAFRRGREIGRGVFSGGNLRLDFQLQPELPRYEGAAPPVARMDLMIHGQHSAYIMGQAQWTSFFWPDSPSASLTVTTQQGQLPALDFDGDWAWFRLLEQARVVGDELHWRFATSAGGTLTARYRLSARNSSAPFQRPTGFFSFSPPSRLN